LWSSRSQKWYAFGDGYTLLNRKRNTDLEKELERQVKTARDSLHKAMLLVDTARRSRVYDRHQVTRLLQDLEDLNMGARRLKSLPAPLEEENELERKPPPKKEKPRKEPSKTEVPKQQPPRRPLPQVASLDDTDRKGVR
jgi:hypothetical protein